jgi:hypothetical protein
METAINPHQFAHQLERKLKMAKRKFYIGYKSDDGRSIIYLDDPKYDEEGERVWEINPAMEFDSAEEAAAYLLLAQRQIDAAGLEMKLVVYDTPPEYIGDGELGGIRIAS